MKIYKNQSNLTLSLITGQDLSNVATSKIKYRLPDTTEGEWTATITGQLVEYEVQNNNLSQIGDWAIWVHLTFNDGRISIGEPVTLTIHEEGT